MFPLLETVLPCDTVTYVRRLAEAAAPLSNAMPNQYPALGEFPTIEIGLAAVPTALIVPTTSIQRPCATFTVVPEAMVNVAAAPTVVFAVTIHVTPGSQVSFAEITPPR